MCAENNYTFPFNRALNEATDLYMCFYGKWDSFVNRTDANGKTIYSITLDDRYTFENLSNGENAFYMTSSGSNGFSQGFDKNLNFKNLINGRYCFYNHTQFTTISSK